jgi:hypothetical protein
MPNRTEARPAKAVLTYVTGSLPLLRLFSTPLNPPIGYRIGARYVEPASPVRKAEFKLIHLNRSEVQISLE